MQRLNAFNQEIMRFMLKINYLYIFIIGKVDKSQFTASDLALFGLVLSKDKKSTEIIADQSNAEGEHYNYHIGADGSIIQVPADSEPSKTNADNKKKGKKHFAAAPQIFLTFFFKFLYDGTA